MNERKYSIDVWTIESSFKIETVSNVLDIQYFLTLTGDCITRVIIDRKGENPLTRDYEDSSSVIVLHMEAKTIKEIDNEFKEKTFYVGNNPSKDMILEQRVKPEFIEIRALNTISDAERIDQIIKIQPVHIAGKGLIKRIVYKKDGLFHLSEFPEDYFDFVYCSTEKTFSELQTEYTKDLENSSSSMLIDEDEVSDEIPYNADKVNKERPLDESGMFG
ncbi:MAG: hypothetical protein KAI71_06170 [Candidatus Pacebacteria bacterium]|nr:hypothetical protein [Candidatus Paceibacterota bacterium]